MKKTFVLALILVISANSTFASKCISAKFNKNKTIKIMNQVSANVLKIDIYDKYESVFANYGVLLYAKATKNEDFSKKVIENYEIYLKKDLLAGGHVDKNACGILGFELFLQTKDANFLEKPLFLADDEWENPRQDGLTKYSRFWTDDIFMVAVLQVYAYKATNKTVYLDRGIAQILAYSAKLQQQNGLFQHTENIPVFWGRANGWAISALAITLENTPKDNPNYPALMDIYKKMATALPKYQDANGLWHQVILDQDSFAETSCTAMFTFAFAKGVKNGWLDKSFHQIALKGFNGLLKKVKDGQLEDVCCGTDEGRLYNHYLNRPRITGDFHGQAPLLWAAAELLEL